MTQKTRTAHLICNAHLDPVWLWQWEEGAAEAISTFRTAADLCDEFEGFVFNHNEAILYRWVEEFEPELFARIQRLVGEGRWHIMGGWHLQPDCNMPSGEFFVRQILEGKEYFRDRFGVEPTTAINFDPFGHTRGLVQILAKSGYDSYLFCRPGPEDVTLPSDTFVWVGFDGSTVLGTRCVGGYNSPLGNATGKVNGRLEQVVDDGKPVAVLWGVGNHGGGPSRKDLRDLAAMIREREDCVLTHSTPEAYFAELQQVALDSLPRHEDDINPWAVGCYTSQIRIKQLHRRLESELLALEKMATAAATAGLAVYPVDELKAAMYDLLTCQFHDILPGSSVQPVEEMSLRIMDHGLEQLSRARARVFFALASGQAQASAGQIPILVYNPHPYAFETTVECEFQLADQNWSGTFTNVRVLQNGTALPCQVEKEISNVELDWRKRVVFRARLQPYSMNRFDCALEELPEKPRSAAVDGREIRFETDELSVVIDAATGLMSSYRCAGREWLPEGKAAFEPQVLVDNQDPWGMTVRRFDKVEGVFDLMDPATGSRFSGVDQVIPSVRVVEDGPVRMVVESVFAYAESALCLRYKLPRCGTEVEVEARVFWQQKDRMLKLAVPVDCGGQPVFRGQVAYGVQDLPMNGDEAVAQKWVAVNGDGGTLSLVNDSVYGSDFQDGVLRMTLLRSAAYSGHPIGNKPVVPQDRFTPRIDQGERLYRFWLNAGPTEARMALIENEAQAHHEAPMALSFFPSGHGTAQEPFLTVTDPSIHVAAVKHAESGDGIVVRVYAPSGDGAEGELVFTASGLRIPVSLGAWEIQTVRVDLVAGSYTFTDLLERAVTL